MASKTSERNQAVLSSLAKFYWFLNESSYARLSKQPEACDFAFGNPQEMPLAGFTSALQKWAEPQNKDWYAYTMNSDGARQVVVDSLRQRYGIPFRNDDIFMTNGAFAALAVTLGTIADPGDEIIYISPPWFFYESLILAQGATPVRVQCNLRTFDLDLAAIERAITRRTRGLIINSPNNPTGRIYPSRTLRGLSDLLTGASRRHGRPIYLLSDESYSHIIFSGCAYQTPTAFYPHSFMIYTYGKTLLAPGQRIGYIALPPGMPDIGGIRRSLFATQMITGWAFPNALLQHALPDLEKLSIDIPRLQKKRDRMAHALREMGYKLEVPEGTFYLLVRSPIEDDLAFTEALGECGVLCLPGATFEMPGYFRISLTANEDMIERALPVFDSILWEVTHTESLPVAAD